MTKNNLKFKVGDKVKHILFGKGKIISIKENLYFPYYIKFDSGMEDYQSDYYLTLIKPL
jgi:hypothetical protein